MMIKWYTDTDEFELGQWIRGKVDEITMPPDAKYLALKIMGSRARDPDKIEDQHCVICKPHYFSGIEALIGGLCYTHAYFLEDGRLLIECRNKHVIHSATPCPFERVRWTDVYPFKVVDHESWYADKEAHHCHDQQGRPFLIEKGKIFALDGDEPRLLIDTNPFQFEKVLPPPGAHDW
ncbi:MAG: hypothetical protein R2688_07120 [Fimbriimonadaceae bacterium]